MFKETSDHLACTYIPVRREMYKSAITIPLEQTSWISISRVKTSFSVAVKVSSTGQKRLKSDYSAFLLIGV